MIARKSIFLSISMGVLLCTAPLSHASNFKKTDYYKQHKTPFNIQNHTKYPRRMDQHQKHKTLSNQQMFPGNRATYQSKKVAYNETFPFGSTFQRNNLQANALRVNTLAVGFLITLLLTSSVEAIEYTPSSTQFQPGSLVELGNGHSTSRLLVGNSQLKSATTSGLASIFCPLDKWKTCATILGNEVIFGGSEQDVDDIIKKVEDFPYLRKHVIPTSSSAAKTNAHPNPRLGSWNEVEASLGVNHETFNNMAFLDDTEKQLVTIDYKGSETKGKSFNQKTADAYIETLKDESPFFEFLSGQNNELVRYTNEHVFINYTILDDYFSRLDLKKNQQIDGSFSITIPLEVVLKRLIAAASGPVSLEKSHIPGKFHVRTVNVVDGLSPDERQVTPPIVEIIIDTSGSMDGEPINTVNENLPRLLKEFANKLQENHSLKTNIYSLNDEFNLYQSFDLGKNSNPKWLDMVSSGGTDLTPIGRKLKIEDGENLHKVVVAFTDGEHMSTKNHLNKDYYDELKKLQKSGSFAQPFLCKVGEGTEDFFKNIAEIFSGSYSKEDTIEECWKKVSAAIPDLLESKVPLVLTISGNNEVVWLGNSENSIHTTSQIVGNNDEIVVGKFNTIVVTIPKDIDDNVTREKKRAQLLKELAEIVE